MIDTVFGIKIRMSGLCINRCRPIIGRLLDADYRPIIGHCLIGASLTATNSVTNNVQIASQFRIHSSRTNFKYNSENLTILQQLILVQRKLISLMDFIPRRKTDETKCV